MIPARLTRQELEAICNHTHRAVAVVRFWEVGVCGVRGVALSRHVLFTYNCQPTVSSYRWRVHNTDSQLIWLFDLAILLQYTIHAGAQPSETTHAIMLSRWFIQNVVCHITTISERKLCSPYHYAVCILSTALHWTLHQKQHRRLAAAIHCQQNCLSGNLRLHHM